MTDKNFVLKMYPAAGKISKYDYTHTGRRIIHAVSYIILEDSVNYFGNKLGKSSDSEQDAWFNAKQRILERMANRFAK